ncbi:hypothetical protein DLJ54_07375 [Corynebacterium heidelbergense]|uniref:Uncharacterized protein n=1 Tax=Corynebacterium heidelbergense TaxID=2055947 RepID=A0A364V4S8_9CORY|nr:hypothetical protein DLJ54_07375 [Corynebacterium heidelbergense]
MNRSGKIHSRRVRHSVRRGSAEVANFSSRTQARTRKPMPRNVMTVVVCSIWASTLSPGTPHRGLFTTGRAPAPKPPMAISTVPKVPSQIVARSCWGAPGGMVGGAEGLRSSWSCAERDPANPRWGSWLRRLVIVGHLIPWARHALVDRGNHLGHTRVV